MEVSLVKAINNRESAHQVIPLNTCDITVSEFAPQSDWSVMNEHDHFVQFYETDISLLDSLSDYIGTGLRAGDGCIVVTRQAQRERLDERLQAYGLDVAAARACGQYVSLDAGETLSQFTVDGHSEPERFSEVIGNVITRTADGRRRVRIFGDMVALLCDEGNHAGAIHLENLWNDLSKTHSFSLFCAYPMNNFGEKSLGVPLGDICAQHSRVIPAESYSALISPDERLRAIIQLQQKARLLEAEIAERERLLVREQIARAEAETANRLKDEFLATVSHELRTPLNAIIGWTYMLRNSKLDEATLTRAVETIERNAQSQAQLIEDILDVSRAITGRLRLNIEPVDMASVINAAIDAVQLAADAKGIQLEVTLEPSARRVSGDASRLQQVIWNLLSNAIKFTPEGGRVSVQLERAGGSAQIRISDTGAGISADFLPFIFERFRQADGTSTRRHGGLGLGLAIVRHLVELHGGTVTAESPGEGCGATFTIKLPLAAIPEHPKKRGRNNGDSRSKEIASAETRALTSLDGVRVLLVDDDQDTLNMLSTVLSEQRATVQTATSVTEALETLEWYKPDVLVSDLAMPDEDGYTLIRQVRAREAGNGRQTPAVALTAYVRVKDRSRALSAGFNLFVPKPVEPNELITAIANLAEPGANKFRNV
jgi:signal transduction histidine kinase/CheY-like chemotaxis protein